MSSFSILIHRRAPDSSSFYNFSIFFPFPSLCFLAALCFSSSLEAMESACNHTLPKTLSCTPAPQADELNTHRGLLLIAVNDEPSTEDLPSANPVDTHLAERVQLASTIASRLASLEKLRGDLKLAQLADDQVVSKLESDVERLRGELQVFRDGNQRLALQIQGIKLKKTTQTLLATNYQARRRQAEKASLQMLEAIVVLKNSPYYSDAKALLQMPPPNLGIQWKNQLLRRIKLCGQMQSFANSRSFGNRALHLSPKLQVHAYVLRIGAVMEFFVSEDGKLIGRRNFVGSNGNSSNKSWTINLDPSDQEAIISGVRIARGLEAPKWILIQAEVKR